MKAPFRFFMLTVLLCFINQEAREAVRASESVNRFVILTASYKNSEYYKFNLDSVFAQEGEWFLIYIDDASPDGTGELVKAYIEERGFEDRALLIQNSTRCGAMENQYHAIHDHCHDDDVVVILDGDDRFAHDGVIIHLTKIYEPHIWLTYGQFREYPSGVPGFCMPMPAWVVAENQFRYFPHIPSHLRTFRASLFKTIPREDFMIDGQFLDMCCDMAAMIPMIERARKGHFLFDPTVHVDYNAINPLNDHKVSKDRQLYIDGLIRSRPRYEALDSL